MPVRKRKGPLKTQFSFLQLSTEVCFSWQSQALLILKRDGWMRSCPTFFFCVGASRPSSKDFQWRQAKVSNDSSPIGSSSVQRVHLFSCKTLTPCEVVTPGIPLQELTSQGIQLCPHAGSAGFLCRSPWNALLAPWTPSCQKVTMTASVRILMGEIKGQKLRPFKREETCYKL